MKEKTHPFHTKLCAFRCLILGPQSLIREVSNVEKYSFLEKNYVTIERGVSNNVSYYQQFSITHYQERFYDNKNFEWLPIVSTAFKLFAYNFAHHFNE